MLRLVLIPLVFLLTQIAMDPRSAPDGTADAWIIPVREPKPEWKRLKVAHQEAAQIRLPDASIVTGSATAPVDPVGQTIAAASPQMSNPAAPDWQIGELYIESSSVTPSGQIEYRVRASLRANPSAQGGAIALSARPTNPEVALVSRDLHFSVRAGDDLDTLSRDSIVVRVPGGQSFEPSMLRWSVQQQQASAEAQSGLQ